MPTTAHLTPAASNAVARWVANVDLPEPGAPAMPTSTRTVSAPCSLTAIRVCTRNTSASRSCGLLVTLIAPAGRGRSRKGTAWPPSPGSATRRGRSIGKVVQLHLPLAVGRQHLHPGASSSLGARYQLGPGGYGKVEHRSGGGAHRLGIVQVHAGFG